MTAKKKTILPRRIFVFAGAILIAILLSWSGYQYYQQREQVISYFRQPKIGDQAILKSPEENYIIIKIVNIENSIISYAMSNSIYESFWKAKKELPKITSVQNNFYHNHFIEIQYANYIKMNLVYIKRDLYTH